MKHISEILRQRSASIFADQSSKGSREWSAFNSVRDDRRDLFPVAPMRMRTLNVRSAIEGETIIPINRYPRQLTLLPAQQ